MVIEMVGKLTTQGFYTREATRAAEVSDLSTRKKALAKAKRKAKAAAMAQLRDVVADD